MQLEAIQKALKESNIDGWLFYDFHNRDAIAHRILNIDTKRFTSRRWFYYIPAEGTPKKLVHSIETYKLAHLPGEQYVYLPWEQQHALLREILADAKKIAMQYSPMNAIPYVSIVDGGTIDLIRSFGIEVVSSADLVSIFESHLSMEDFETHRKAGILIQEIKNAAFKEIAHRIRSGKPPKEYEIQEFMHNLMRQNNLAWGDGPVVAINEHAADPHFEPTPENSYNMQIGDLVLIDLWAKLDQPRSIFYDITWMGFIGETVPEKIESLFSIIAKARDTAYNLVKERFASNTPVYGWEVDKACREVVEQAGFGKYFIHRTGHNIGEQVHGNGTHIDNLETKDLRRIIPGSCFSIEPGIYIPDEKLGFRTEIDVFVTDDGKVEVIGDIQQKVIPIMSL
jgi:Xaa-Pro aminopeptidase